MALYLTRYLKLPPTRIPGEGGEPLEDLPTDPETIQAPFLMRSTGNNKSILRQGSWRSTSRLGHSSETLQILEAGVRQVAAWGEMDESGHILIAVARYLAAHSPTERAGLQTADVARRLMRGGDLHQE
jgi:hypothetical protein